MFLCNRPPIIENTILLIDGYGAGDKITIQCKIGYWFSAGIYEKEIVCDLSGFWLNIPQKGCESLFGFYDSIFILNCSCVYKTSCIISDR